MMENRMELQRTMEEMEQELAKMRAALAEHGEALRAVREAAKALMDADPLQEAATAQLPGTADALAERLRTLQARYAHLSAGEREPE